MASPFDMSPPRLPTCSRKRPSPAGPSETPAPKIAKLALADQPATAVTLSREQLLTFIRPQLDEFVTAAIGNRKLTKTERKEVSRQRKLIKNRNSAAASRQRKREHQQQMEQSLDRLVEEQAAVRDHVVQLQAENRRMRDEARFIQRIIHLHPVGRVLWKRQQAKKQWEFTSSGVKTVAKLFLLFLLAAHLLFSAPLSLPPAKMPSGAFSYVHVPWDPSVMAPHPALGAVEGLMSLPEQLEGSKGSKETPVAFTTPLELEELPSVGKEKVAQAPVPLEELPFPASEWNDGVEKARNSTWVDSDDPQVAVPGNEVDVESLDAWLEELDGRSHLPEREADPLPAQFEISADLFSSIVASSVAATLPSMKRSNHFEQS